MSEHLISGITAVIQRVYGDATQTVLDRRAAEEIWAYLLSVGVVPHETVAAIVAAAGGRVTIPDRLMVDPPDLVLLEKQFNDRTLITRPK